VGSSGSDKYIRAQADHFIHRGTQRAFDRMGEGIQASHLAGCHPTHLRFGRLSAKN
jgi:hypothetical protein